MIVIYPLIVSKTVNPDVLPGVCKALEKYILVYKQDKLFDTVNKELVKKAKSKAGKEQRRKGGKKAITIIKSKAAGMFRLENVVIEEVLEGKFKGKMPGLGDDDEDRDKTTTTKKPTYEKPKTTVIAKGPDIIVPPQIKAIPPRKETIMIGKSPADTLTVEPTYIQIHVEDSGSQILGIKVVPFIIQNDTSLIQLMMNDKNRSSFAANIHIQSRKLLRFMYRIANSLWNKTIGPALGWTGMVGSDLYGGSLSGNWKKDIILGLTDYKKDLFIMLNNVDLRKDFTLDASSVKKLYSMGWSSFIINDDVNTRTVFCMKEFKGMCSITNHAYLYASISREVGTAFKDIEDIKRSSGPLFRVRGRVNKMLLKDDLALEKLRKYYPNNFIKEEVLEEEFLEEGIIGDAYEKAKKYFTSSTSAKRFLTNLKGAIESKDFNRFKKLIKSVSIPQVPLDSIKKYSAGKVKTFNNIHRFSKKVLQNSLPGIPDKVADGVASLIAIQCKDKKKASDLLKRIVIKTRSNMPKAIKQGDQDWDKELIIALIFAAVLIAGIGTAGYGIALNLGAIFDSFFGGIHTIVFIVFLISICIMLSSIASAVETSKTSKSAANVV
jgi:hypothetical protein